MTIYTILTRLETETETGVAISVQLVESPILGVLLLGGGIMMLLYEYFPFVL